MARGDRHHWLAETMLVAFGLVPDHTLPEARAGRRLSAPWGPERKGCMCVVWEHFLSLGSCCPPGPTSLQLSSSSLLSWALKSPVSPCCIIKHQVWEKGARKSDAVFLWGN